MDAPALVRAFKVSWCVKRLSMGDLNESSPTDSINSMTTEQYYELAIREFLASLGYDEECIGQAFRGGDDSEDIEMMLRSISEDPCNFIPFELSKPEAGALFELGQRQFNLYQDFGVPRFLTQAIELLNEAIRFSTWDDRVRPLAVGALGCCLGARYERDGFREDLDLAISQLEAATTTAPTLFSRSGSLQSLGNQRMRRWERTQKTSDLVSAFAASLEGLRVSPPHKPLRAGLFNALSTQSGLLYDTKQCLLDIHTAIFCGERSVAEAEDKILKATFSNNLSLHYERRYEHLRKSGSTSLADLEKAITLAREALTEVSPNHPFHAVRLNNLARYLELRYKVTHKNRDISEAIECFTTGWLSEAAFLGLRISMARDAALLHCQLSNWKLASDLLQKAVTLLPQVSGYSLTNEDKRAILATYSGISSLAAAVLLKAGQSTAAALKTLEEGRGIIASLLMDIRSDVSDLSFETAELAEEYTYLRKVLDSKVIPTDETQSDGDGFVVSQVDYRKWAERRLKHLGMPNNQNLALLDLFLRRSPTLFQDVGHNWAIAIINISSVRCDAFLINSGGILPDPVSLPVTKAEIEAMVEEVDLQIKSGDRKLYDEKPLRWLWDCIAYPILKRLGYDKTPTDDENLPNIWWITTGRLGRLPIHAAGYHSERSGRTVIDKVISSYATSLKALLREPHRRPSNASKGGAVLVGKQHTARMRQLPFVKTELEAVERLCLSLSIKPRRVPPKKHKILSHLKKCDIFHFAGHGVSHAQTPSLSALILDGKRLTVGELLESSVDGGNPFLGYLSACSTASNASVHEVDETFHLVSAMQLAGFRHVVGTLWPVLDKICVRVATTLYETLELQDGALTDASVRKGLHKAIKTLRDECFQDDVRNVTEIAPIKSESGKPRDNVECPPGSPFTSVGGQNQSQGNNCQSHERGTLDQGQQTAKASKEHRTQQSLNETAESRATEFTSTSQSQNAQRNRLSWVPYMHYGP